MKTTFILIIIGLLCSCQVKETKSTHNFKENNVSEGLSKPNQDSVHHGYNELANEYERTHFTISDYNTDNPEIANIARPAKNSIYTKFDTALLFNIWVQFPNWPHADFWWTGKSFFIVDYDGDGDMPFTLNDSLLTVYYNDFVQTGKVISVSKDSLLIRWENTTRTTGYFRWKD